MILDKAVQVFFKSRLKNISFFERYPDVVQTNQLKQLIDTAKKTEWGMIYHYRDMQSYSDFASRVPVQDYEEVKPFIQRMMQGEKNILWPEKIRWFAKSSGTTDKSKFIPVSPSSLNKCHYQGAKDTVTLYLNNKPGSSIFSGKGLILGGSHKPETNQGIHSGDLSAVLIENMNPLAHLIRTPSKKVVLMDEWEEKLELLCKYTIHRNVTNLSGVPSWFLVLLKKVLEKTGKSYVNEVWPNLEVFFHGGVSFLPYRSLYKELIPSEKMSYMEVYNASEGFFAIQNDLNDPGLLLLLDYGIFYEFIPMEDIDLVNPRVVPLDEVELGKNYAIVITTNNGLWRYKIGDTVKFTSKQPYKIIITGRIRHFINAFGEELMVDNAERALTVACKETGAQIREYTAAPVYMSSHSKGKHQWLIEFEQLPTSMDQFAIRFDQTLKAVNSDYEAKRYKNMTLDQPEIVMARSGLFYEWLSSKGKLGGQHKVPRLSNNREIMDALIVMNRS